MIAHHMQDSAIFDPLLDCEALPRAEARVAVALGRGWRGLSARWSKRRLWHEQWCRRRDLAFTHHNVSIYFGVGRDEEAPEHSVDATMAAHEDELRAMRSKLVQYTRRNL